MTSTRRSCERIDLAIAAAETWNGMPAAMPVGGWDLATIRIEPTGCATVLTGCRRTVAAQETTFA